MQHSFTTPVGLNRAVPKIRFQYILRIRTQNVHSPGNFSLYCTDVVLQYSGESSFLPHASATRPHPPARAGWGAKDDGLVDAVCPARAHLCGRLRCGCAARPNCGESTNSNTHMHLNTLHWHNECTHPHNHSVHGHTHKNACLLHTKTYAHACILCVN